MQTKKELLQEFHTKLLVVELQRTENEFIGTTGEKLDETKKINSCDWVTPFRLNMDR